MNASHHMLALARNTSHECKPSYAGACAECKPSYAGAYAPDMLQRRQTVIITVIVITQRNPEATPGF
eukprot:1907375-Karenia_brevis.AAC.1